MPEGGQKGLKLRDFFMLLWRAATAGEFKEVKKRDFM